MQYHSPRPNPHAGTWTGMRQSRKPVYRMGGKGVGGMYRPYGELTGSQQRVALGVAGVGVVVAIATAWTFAVGPWAVKQFKPEWGYGKRLVTSFLAGSAIGLARQAVGSKD